MATFRKFGLSSSSSPSRTPAFVHRSRHRRMTLGTLLLNPIENNRKQQQQPRQSSLMRYLITNDQPVIIGKNTLMDLLSTSNPFDVVEKDEYDNEQVLSRKTRKQEQTQSLNRSPIKGSKLRNGGNRKGRRGMMSKGKAGFAASPGVRFRFLLKRSWRPMLIDIPEGELMEHY